MRIQRPLLTWAHIPHRSLMRDTSRRVETKFQCGQTRTAFGHVRAFLKGNYEVIHLADTYIHTHTYRWYVTWAMSGAKLAKHGRMKWGLLLELASGCIFIIFQRLWAIIYYKGGSIAGFYYSTLNRAKNAQNARKSHFFPKKVQFSCRKLNF